MVHERDQRILRIQDMLRRLMRHNADANIANALEKMHAAEVASIFLHLEPDERQHAFRAITDADRRAEILSECDVHVIRELLEPMLN